MIDETLFATIISTYLQQTQMLTSAYIKNSKTFED